MTEKDKVYIGALLHDIGKFYQRGDKDFKFTKHPALSAAFLNNLLEDEVIAAIVAYHQIEDLRQSKLSEPVKRLANIVCEADTLASGERISAEHKVQKPLISILSKVRLDTLRREEYQQPISSITPSGFRFPQKDWTSTDLEKDYEERWRNFVEEAEKFGQTLQSDAQAVKDTLYALSLKYLWCIPSASYQTKPDISLHEHHRLAAAIAICMYDYLQDNQNESPENRETLRYLLFCADLTGIQKYLYNIKPKGAAKALKGRSFFLQQLLDSIASYVLKEFGLERANLLYSSGGKFFALLPNLKSAQDRIARIEKEVAERLLVEYGISVSVVFASTALSGNDFNDSKKKECKIPRKWEEVQKSLQQRKTKKFSQVFSKSFFLSDAPAGELVLCSATDLELCTLDEARSATIKEETGYKELTLANGKKIYQQVETEEYISAEQHVAQQIGKKLREGECLAIDEESNSNLDFSALGLERFDLVDIKKAKAQRLFLLNDDDFISKLPASYSRGFRFYGGNWSLEKDYDKLIELSTGLKRLGVLRLDVDNLGRIFEKGLGTEATFSRVIQLSTMLDFFFSSYLNRLSELKWSVEAGVNDREGEMLKDVMQIVYAGGDDVFIVGVWNVLPDVAIWIYDNFKAFACDNPCFTLSAGIAIFDAKSPLYKAALAAGEAEDKAKGKRHTRNGEKEKDAICFLGTPMSWSDFKTIRSEVLDLYKAIESKKISRGVIQRLLSIYSEFEAHYEMLKEKKGMEVAKKEMLYGRWRWLAAYSLARLAKQYKDYEQEINALASKLFLSTNTEQDFISLINVLAQWADFLTRKEESK